LSLWIFPTRQPLFYYQVAADALHSKGYQFAHDMLAVSRAAAIAAYQQFVAIPEAAYQYFLRLLHGFPAGIQRWVP